MDNNTTYNSAAWDGYNASKSGIFRPAGLLNSMHATHYNKHYDAGYRVGHQCRNDGEVYTALKLNKTTRAGLEEMRKRGAEIKKTMIF